MYSPADISDNESLSHSNYKPCFGNFAKECSENNNIYNRSLPLDNLPKEIIMSPRSLSTSRCNIQKYNRQCYLFPPRTEKIVAEYKDALDEKYCQQNFVNINDESFLLNLNKRYTKHNEANIATPISPMLNDTKNNSVNYLDTSDELLLEDYTFGDYINIKTKRRDLLK
jgi:hypothetical protein